jgi:hypothetical protein
LTGQTEKVVIPPIVDVFQPDDAENEDKARFGELGGVDVAFMLIVLILDDPLGSDNVNVAVYVPLGKVTGKGVLKFEVVKLNAVPEFVVNVQLTNVVDDMLLPVDMKVKSTLDPAQTFN